MSIFEEYLMQGSMNIASEYGDSSHTETWADEGDEPFGYSGHCDVHSEYVDVND